MYDFLGHKCPNCGKIVAPVSIHDKRKYCNRKCQKEHTKKKRQAEAEEAARIAALHTTLVEQSKCKRCVFGYNYGHVYGCGYVFVKGQTRQSLHPEGLTAECEEFLPKTVGRRPRRRRVE